MIVRVSAPQAALAVHSHLSWLVTDTPYPGQVNQPINVAAEEQALVADTRFGSWEVWDLSQEIRDRWVISDGMDAIPLHPGMVVGSVTPTAPSVPILRGDTCPNHPHMALGRSDDPAVILCDGTGRRSGWSDVSGQILDPTPNQWATPINTPTPCEQRCPECEGEGAVLVDSMTLYGIPGGADWDRCPRCHGAGNCEPWPWTGNTEWAET